MEPEPEVVPLEPEVRLAIERRVTALPAERQHITSTVLQVYENAFQENRWLILVSGSIAALGLPLLASSSAEQLHRGWFMAGLTWFSIMAVVAVVRTLFQKGTQWYLLTRVGQHYETVNFCLTRALIDNDADDVTKFDAEMDSFRAWNTRFSRFSAWSLPITELATYGPLIAGIVCLLNAAAPLWLEFAR